MMNPRKKAIEDGFPIGLISCLAERESWRKEIYRPVYYIHKWWARRLGSVFRAIIIGSCSESGENIENFFYKPTRFQNYVIFDPFMGSGPTIGEAIKLGCRVIGRDVNPVSHFIVSTFVQKYKKEDVIDAYIKIEKNISERILSLYKTKLPDGEVADVLYYFWVKIIPCPECNKEIELFTKRIFSKHAYTKAHPDAKSICPDCGEVNEVRYDDLHTKCPKCNTEYNPQEGNVKNSSVKCSYCSEEFKVIEAVRKLEHPPEHRMYAKMVFNGKGEKVYLPISESDLKSYENSKHTLEDLWDFIPKTKISNGYNTKQIINYNYRYWHQMFNHRQLAALAILVSEIKKIQDSDLKKLFTCLFSGILEFNNIFASFKGEGTGAVRHLFSHHVFKPELQPIEANVWGTPKSSGSFSTLFKSRILKALDYKEDPFEIKISNDNNKTEKVFGINQALEKNVVSNFEKFKKEGDVYLSIGDSSKTDIDTNSIDLVITDPPFFDNVHYSELADFFHVWIKEILESGLYLIQDNTRSKKEVQNRNAGIFEKNLSSVFNECRRVLKDDGLLVFTYHHSRHEGWTSVYKSIRKSGFRVIYAHPVKAEMSVSVPILQSKKPINYDLILVCRKSIQQNVIFNNEDELLNRSKEKTTEIKNKLNNYGLGLSLGDIKVIFMGCLFSELSKINNLNEEFSIFTQLEGKIDENLMEYFN